MDKQYTFDEYILSDLYKDAYRHRPSEQFWRNWDHFTDEQKQAEWDHILQVLQVTIAEDAEIEKRLIRSFEELIQQTIATRAKDRKDAIEILIKETESDYGDIEHFELMHGLPYGYIKKTTLI